MVTVTDKSPVLDNGFATHVYQIATEDNVSDIYYYCMSLSSHRRAR